MQLWQSGGGPRTRRAATDRAHLGFLLLVALVVPGAYYGVMVERGNFHEVVPGRVYRSGQPTAEQLRAWVHRYGLKTIVNLRGTAAPMAREEGLDAAAMGVDEVYLSLARTN